MASISTAGQQSIADAVAVLNARLTESEGTLTLIKDIKLVQYTEQEMGTTTGTINKQLTLNVDVENSSGDTVIKDNSLSSSAEINTTSNVDTGTVTRLIKLFNKNADDSIAAQSTARLSNEGKLTQEGQKAEIDKIKQDLIDANAQLALHEQAHGEVNAAFDELRGDIQSTDPNQNIGTQRQAPEGLKSATASEVFASIHAARSEVSQQKTNEQQAKQALVAQYEAFIGDLNNELEKAEEEAATEGVITTPLGHVAQLRAGFESPAASNSMELTHGIREKLRETKQKEHDQKTETERQVTELKENYEDAIGVLGQQVASLKREVDLNSTDYQVGQREQLPDNLDSDAADNLNLDIHEARQSVQELKKQFEIKQANTNQAFTVLKGEVGKLHTEAQSEDQQMDLRYQSLPDGFTNPDGIDAHREIQQARAGLNTLKFSFAKKIKTESAAGATASVIRAQPDVSETIASQLQEFTISSDEDLGTLETKYQASLVAYRTNITEETKKQALEDGVKYTYKSLEEMAKGLEKLQGYILDKNIPDAHILKKDLERSTPQHRVTINLLFDIADEKASKGSRDILKVMMSSYLELSRELTALNPAAVITSQGFGHQARLASSEMLYLSTSEKFKARIQAVLQSILDKEKK